MNETQPPRKPLKTWSYLSGSRKRPSEYEVVSTGLHYHTIDQDKPWELDPDIPLSDWYRKYRNQSPLQHDDWDAFRDPDQMIYRTYNIVQDGQENYVRGLFDQFNERGHDQMLEPERVGALGSTISASAMSSRQLCQTSEYSTLISCSGKSAKSVPPPRSNVVLIALGGTRWRWMPLSKKCARA